MGPSLRRHAAQHSLRRADTQCTGKSCKAWVHTQTGPSCVMMPQCDVTYSMSRRDHLTAGKSHLLVWRRLLAQPTICIPAPVRWEGSCVQNRHGGTGTSSRLLS